MTKRNPPMGKEAAKDFAVELREIYAKWEADPSVDMFQSGICMALHIQTDSINRHGHDRELAYKHVSLLLDDMQQVLGFGLLAKRGDWTVRPTMCLLMAEWIETEWL